ncbi:queuosine salvage family protein [Candidatus Nanoperiomorbus periodonticus]|uniref:queuosine salvage family protein n=1 Tax=Candidatus Nanoperiomorbus periodonticus TaxID=2171989 RepID=UPI00101C5E41|nr:queuosine salvage family protein [Candidatus Nanoperiomorbus periodonticus]RYC74911.1 hypothetical protein G52EAM_00668 [Candidatus Nanoperiomorbus periodonticus]
MDRILHSIDIVVKESAAVSVDERAIKAFVDTIQLNELDKPQYLFKGDESFSLEQSIAYGFVYNAINFSFWGEPKWKVYVDDKEYDGSVGMQKAMRRAIKSGYDLLSADYLRSISESDLGDILKGNSKIPLFSERLEMLQALGHYVSKRYDGSFMAIVDESGWDAVTLVENLVDEIPSVFNDEENYKGKMVQFYKRAQLVPAYLHGLEQLGVSNHGISRIDELTALADYKVPQMLRKYGILKYREDLSRKVDNFIEIKAGSSEEIEIRAMTIWAVELIVRHLKKSGKSTNALQVDNLLWRRGRIKSPNDKPYHRTRTISY